MTVFKTIFEAAKTVARHPVTRKIAAAVIIIIIKDVLGEPRRRGR